MPIIVTCDKVSMAYVTKESYSVPTWLDALWSCLVFANRVHEIAFGLQLKLRQVVQF